MKDLKDGLLEVEYLNEDKAYEFRKRFIENEAYNFNC